MVAAPTVKKTNKSEIEKESKMPPKLDRSAIVAPPGLEITSPGRIAAAGSTDMFDELRHVVYGTSKTSEVYEFIASHAWEELEQLVKEQPEVAREWIGQDGNDASEWRRLPIHEACIKVAPCIIIACLFEAYPQGLEQKDHAGRLPIHHACSYGQTRDVIEFLLMEYPESINATDKWQRTPTMSAEFSHSEFKNDALELLSKGSKYHNNKKLELNWAKQQAERQQKLQQEHLSTVHKLKEKLLNAQEEAIDEKMKMRDEIIAYESFIGDIDRVLGINQGLRSPRGKKVIKSDSCNSIIEEQLSKLKAHKALLDVRQAGLKSDLDHEREKRQDLEERNKSLSVNLKQELEEKLSVQKQLEEKTKNYIFAQSALEVERRSKEALTLELKESRCIQDSLKSEVAALSDELKAAKNRIDNFEIETEGIRQNGRDLEAKLADEKANSESLEACIADKDDEIASMEEEVIKLSFELEEAMKTYITLEDHICKLKGEISPLTAELNAERQTNAQLLREVEDMRKNQIEMENIVAAALANEENLKKELGGVGAKIDNMQEEYNALLEELRKAQDICTDVREVEARFHSQVTALEEKLDADTRNHQEEKHAWFESKKEMEEIISGLRCEAYELRAENEGLANQVDDSNQKVVQLGQAAQDARIQISRTIAALTAQKEEAEHHAEKIARLHAQERGEFISRIADLESVQRNIDREKANEQINAVNAVEALEEALEVAASENAKVLKQIVQSHKKHVNIHVSSRIESPRKTSKSPHKKSKTRFAYNETSDEEVSEY